VKYLIDYENEKVEIQLTFIKTLENSKVTKEEISNLKERLLRLKNEIN